MKIFLIVREKGLGTIDSPVHEFHTGIAYKNKEDAEAEADRLWKKEVPKKLRDDSWCPIHFRVRSIKIK